MYYRLLPQFLFITKGSTRVSVRILPVMFTVFIWAAMLLSTEVVRAQTLGDYGNATLTAGGNTTIAPTAAPTGASSVVAFTNSNFIGNLTVNPLTGIVTITNAKQAGTYTVTVRAFGSMTAQKTFTLTINNPAVSSGTFIASTNVVVGNEPRAVAIGDFNGDGQQDLAIANNGSDTVSIRLGDGAGGFTASTPVFVNSASSIAIGDFNGNGKLDLAFASSKLNLNSISIRLGDGAGGFSGTTEIGVGSRSESVAIGDFNGDGRQDLAASNYDLKTVSIRLGDGSGGFSGSTEVPVGITPTSLAIGDFNKDGKQDFAVANLNSNSVSIRLGNGLGEFTGNTDMAVGDLPWSISIGDFNGDGNQDLAVAHSQFGANRVSIRLGDGAGGFIGSTDVGLGFGSRSVAIGDFNGDGRQDLAIVNGGNANRVSIRLGDGAGGFSGTSEVGVGDVPFSVAIGDFNGDGVQDFATANYGSNNVSIQLGANTILPVQFTKIHAEEINKDVRVCWAVLTENNMDRYEVDYSADGTNFGKAVKVNAKNQSPAAYEWLHVKPVAGNHFYRITAFSRDGKSLQTQIVKVTISGNNPTNLKVYPTIVSQSNAINVKMISFDKGIYQLQVVDMAGKVMATQSINHRGGSATIQVNLPPAASTGQYQIRLFNKKVNYVKSLLRTP